MNWTNKQKIKIKKNFELNSLRLSRDVPQTNYVSFPTHGHHICFKFQHFAHNIFTWPPFKFSSRITYEYSIISFVMYPLKWFSCGLYYCSASAKKVSLSASLPNAIHTMHAYICMWKSINPFGLVQLWGLRLLAPSSQLESTVPGYYCWCPSHSLL